MAIDLKKFEQQALKFPPKTRAKLAEYLIASLDDINDKENEHLWIEEAERRYQEYKKGTISGKTAKEVFKKAYNKIK